MNTPQEWGPEETAELKRLWEVENWSAAKIAQKLGPHRTRNSIIGKVHRLDLAPRLTLVRKKPKPKYSYVLGSGRSRKGVKPRPPMIPVAVSQTPTSHPAPPTILLAKDALERGDHKCRYPTGEGEPGHTEYYFCGLRANAASSYCDVHHQLTHISIPVRHQVKGVSA